MDAMYLKFLRARKWDLEAAYKQYTDTGSIIMFSI